MSLRLVGAGLPRTGTESLQRALQTLLGAPCFHMHELPAHPYDVGTQWKAALAGDEPDWDEVFDGYAAAVDWPTSLCWQPIAAAYPDAVVLLSHRDSTDIWLDSMEATVLPVARACAPADWTGGRDLVVMLEKFTGTADWDDRAVLRAAHDSWLASVRAHADPARLVEWQPGDGWEPLCGALGTPVPDASFPWENRREDWVY